MVVGLCEDARVGEVPPEGGALHFLHPVATALAAFPILDNAVACRCDGIIRINGTRVIARLCFACCEVAGAADFVVGQSKRAVGALGSSAIDQGDGSAAIDRIGAQC